MGISTALLPFSQNLSHFYSCVFGYGLGSGVWFSAYNVWVIEIWQQNSAPILQLSQFMYGIGTIFGPLIDRPYLTGELIHSLNNGAINTMGNTTEDQSLEAMLAEDNVIRRDKLHTPFLIIGALECIGPILLLVMYLIKPYNSETPVPPPTAPAESADKTKPTVSHQKIMIFKSTKIRHSLLVPLLSNFVAIVFVSDNIYLKFSATYFQYIPLQLNASESAGLVVQMAIIYTIGRALTVLISLRLNPQTIISYHMIVLMVSLSILSVGHDSYLTLQLGSLMMSFGFSALLPAIFAFVGQYVEVTNKLGTVMIFNCGLLNAFIPFILGSYVETYPNIFLSIILINFLVAFVILLTITLLTNKTENMNIIGS
ncbi:unnamed protein product [Oppiella nova]|uniref:Uncharacterized protein n=1 Tax=Oppiella nova TaxID=334625 RepID=A0A7R9LZV0_9ACAR|nr:unnamed protein product [Oppiella nova]CAG2168310.1 unnamed protein product [Oppiella nova]